MTFYRFLALARRNAAACEAAVHPRCTCACGGRAHGIAHPSLTAGMELGVSKADLLLMCGHPSPYMCSKCARCTQCCKCESVRDGTDKLLMPPLVSTLKLESQDRLRELRRALNEGR
jgi:hypothetical protein